MLKAELSPSAEGAGDDERALLAGLKGGDRASGREFYDRYADRIYRFIFHALAGTSRADAEDLLQDTFMALAEALPYFRGDCSLFTFACAIARRKVASFVRRNSRRARLDSAPVANQSSNTADAVAALAAISREHREVLLLKYVEELTVAEIASILELSQHAVESRLARARRALARKLGAV
jgi:RNA polymerase sigma-70 factor, ECF subfamily